MKLLTKLNLYYFFVLLVAFVIGSAIAYKVLERAVKRGVHRVMKAEEDYIRERIRDSVSLEILNNDPRQAIRQIELPLDRPLDQFDIYDTLIYRNNCGCTLPYRTLDVNRQIGSNLYKIRLVRPMVQTDDLIRRTSVLLARVALVVLVMLLLFNYFFSRSLLRPFYRTLERLKKHRLTQNQPLQLPKSHTREFEELNALLRQMTGRIQDDYLNLKEYTENTAHEMQTPLTIIKAKLELLAEVETYTPEQSQQLEAAYQATLRLSKLGQTLGVLTKIENQQFQNLTPIDLQPPLETLLQSFEELIALKHLQLNCKAQRVLKPIHPYLLDLLLTNLIKNSITHNVEKGVINIELNPQYLIISNTGPELPFPPERIFDRFATSKPGVSFGLGLAIVQKICEQAGWRISYQFKGGQHRFSVAFADV